MDIDNTLQHNSFQLRTDQITQIHKHKEILKKGC